MAAVGHHSTGFNQAVDNTGLPGQDFHLLEQSPIDNFQLNPHAGDNTFIDHFAIDERLGGTHAAARTNLDHLAQHDNAMTGSHRAAELDPIDARKAQEAPTRLGCHGVVAHQLGSRLDHQHAGEDRATRNVGANPIFFALCVVVADDDALLVVHAEDAIQELELVSMRIDLVNLALGNLNVVEIDG